MKNNNITINDLIKGFSDPKRSYFEVQNSKLFERYRYFRLTFIDFLSIVHHMLLMPEVCNSPALKEISDFLRFIDVNINFIDYYLADYKKEREVHNEKKAKQKKR